LPRFQFPDFQLTNFILPVFHRTKTNDKNFSKNWQKWKKQLFFMNQRIA